MQWELRISNNIAAGSVRVCFLCKVAYLLPTELEPNFRLFRTQCVILIRLLCTYHFRHAMSSARVSRALFSDIIRYFAESGRLILVCLLIILLCNFLLYSCKNPCVDCLFVHFFFKIIVFGLPWTANSTNKTWSWCLIFFSYNFIS